MEHMWNIGLCVLRSMYFLQLNLIGGFFINNEVILCILQRINKNNQTKQALMPTHKNPPEQKPQQNSSKDVLKGEFSVLATNKEKDLFLTKWSQFWNQFFIHRSLLHS